MAGLATERPAACSRPVLRRSRPVGRAGRRADRALAAGIRGRGSRRRGGSRRAIRRCGRVRIAVRVDRRSRRTRPRRRRCPRRPRCRPAARIRPEPGRAGLGRHAGAAAPPARRHHADPGPGGRADRPGQRTETGRSARAGYRGRPAADPPGRGRPEPGAGALAAVAVLRADLVSVRRPDPDGHRPGPDDQPQRAVRRRDGGAGEYDPGAAAGDRHPFRERHDLGRCGSPTRSSNPWRRGASSPRTRPGSGPRPTTRCCRSPRPTSTSRARPGGWPSPARPPRTPRPSRRSPAPTPAWDRAWRPTIAVH